MRRRLALWAVVVVLDSGCGYVCRGPDACPRLEEEGARARSLERAARWLGRKPLSGELAWYVEQGGKALGERFEPWRRRVVVDRRRMHGVDRHMLRRAGIELEPLAELEVPARPAALDVAAPIALHDRQAGWDVRRLSADCPDLDAKKSRELRRLLESRGESYLAAAQLWAVVMAHALDCEVDDFERLRARHAAQVRAELLADPRMHALTAHRMASLCWAGLGEWIPDEYLERLIAAQHPVGGWLDPHFDGGANARPTALEMTSMAFYVLAACGQERRLGS